MSRKTQFIEVFVQAATMLTCIGTVVAAGFTVNRTVELYTNSSLVEQINHLNGNILTRVKATVALAIAGGFVIPLGLIMIIISLCKINLGRCTKVLAVLDVVLILFAVCGYGAAGVLGAITVKDWSDDVLSSITDEDVVKKIRFDVAATVACSLLACIVCVALLLFISVQYVRYKRHNTQERSQFKYSTYDALSLK